MKSKFLVLVIIIFSLASIPFAVFAGINTVHTDAPFDGGLSLLIAAGIGYASKKAYDKRKKDRLKADMDK